MRLVFFLLFWLPLVQSTAASSLQFVPSPNVSPALNEQVVTALPNGSVLIAGSVTSPHQVPTVSILNSSGIQIGALATSLGSGDGQILDAAVDPSGNIWIIGVTDSDDFPLLHPLFSQKLPYQSTGFVARLDPSLNLLFSTFLGGQGTGGQAVSTPTKLMIDASGNVYIAGHTGESGFPTTGTILGTGAPGPSSTTVSPQVYGFVVKISSD